MSPTRPSPSSASRGFPRPGAPAAESIDSLVRSHGARLYSLATRLCGNADDAEDMVQSVFLQAFRKWHTFKGQSSPGTWLYAIAARSCKARMRRKGGTDRRVPAMSQLMPWTETRVADLPDSKPGLAGSGGPVAATIQREAAGAVQQAILTLPEHFRVPLVLKEMLEMSLDEVAAALNLKPQTVKTRVHRARLLLRKTILNSPGMPKHAAPQPAYDKQVCLDLLNAKLDAMDAGRGTPLGHDIVCQRCRAVFAELDLMQDSCSRLAEGTLPSDLRAKIRKAIRAQTAHPLKPRA